MSATVEWFLSLIPHFDGQTIFSIIVGLVVSLLTFAWAYKNTIGVRQEKSRTANIEITAVVLRRIAIERDVLTALQFDALRETKAYRAGVPLRSLWIFTGVLNAVLTDILENAFLDKAAKSNVLQIIESSRETNFAHATQPQDAKSDNSIPVLAAALALTVGITSGFLTFFLKGTYPTIWATQSDDHRLSFLMLSLVATVLLLLMAFVVWRADQRRRYMQAKQFHLVSENWLRSQSEDYTKT